MQKIIDVLLVMGAVAILLAVLVRCGFSVKDYRASKQHPEKAPAGTNGVPMRP